MDTILDHIKWRGHETFEQTPFNEIDNLVLCQLSYYELSEVFENEERATPAKCLCRIGAKNVHLRIFGEDAERPLYEDFYQTVASVPRYKDIVMSDYVEKTDDTIQFAALTYHLPEDRLYVAFRGTDDTIIGWKEDFMISFTEIPAQKRAVEYLEAIAKKYPDKKIYVGGHSKGGNLALYAALFANVRQEYEHIFLNDSPGMCADVLDLSGLDRIRNRITRIMPEFSVVGRLFEIRMPDERIVKSNAKGLMQHMMLSWGVNYGKLNTVAGYLPESNMMGETINKWIGNVSNEERKHLVDQLFSALSANGAKTLSDISSGGINGFEQVLIRLAGADPEIRRTAAKLPERAVFGGAAETVRNSSTIQTLIHSRLVQGLVAILAGLMFLIIPETNTQYIFLVAVTAFVLFLIGRTVYRLYRSKWNLYQERTMVLSAIMAIVVYQFMLFKEHAIFLFSSIFLGTLFLMLFYSCASELKKGQIPKTWIKVRFVIEMVVFLVLGLFVLVSPEHTMKTYALSVGIILVLDGLSRLIEYLQARAEQKKS